METENIVKDKSMSDHSKEDNTTESGKVQVTYKFCDIQQKLIDAWNDCFSDYIPERVQVCKGDIFKEGPAADAIVSPANSFGFMDGGIDMAYSRHFGWQMQTRLQKVIREQYDGELLVGQAAIVTTVEHHNRNIVDWSKFNEGHPIKYLISAPTMRVPCDVLDTCNAYLAFRAVILEVQKFNASHPDEPIRSVLCPGLGTAVGRMPRDRCAYQMLKAFENFDLLLDSQVLHPNSLSVPLMNHYDMVEFGGEDLKQPPPKDKSVVKTSSKTTNKQTVGSSKKDGSSSTVEKGPESENVDQGQISGQKKGTESKNLSKTLDDKGAAGEVSQEQGSTSEKKEPAEVETSEKC